MPYHKKRKTDRPKRKLIEENVMRSAVEEVLGGKGVNTVARDKGIDRMTLKRYVRKMRQDKSTVCKPNYVTKQVFTIPEENNLSEYILQASRLHCGLSTKTTRKLAYQYAVAIRPPKKIPESWSKNLSAGKDWLKDFMRRRSELALRTPEATSMARATAFNKQTVLEFFTNVRDVRSRYPYSPQNIYNVDETGVTTVQRPCQVLAAKGAKQVGHRTGAERGTLITVCCCVNAIGNSVPPFFIFPRVRFSDRMISGCPPGSVGVASPSGWMNAETFLQWMKHFINHTRCGVDNKVLLILDNHESHVSYECLELAKRSGVMMVTLPPHCSHKLQPLDRTVFGPFKRYYNSACDDWVVENPRPMQITDVAALVGRAYPLAFTPSNITSGFAVSGIEPFNADIFQDDDFIAASVTDRPEPAVTALPTIVATSESTGNLSSSGVHNAAAANGSSSLTSHSRPTENATPSTSNVTVNSSSVAVHQSPGQATPSTPTDIEPSHSSPITLEKIRPFPKAGARKSTGGRKRQKTRILTDTPVRDEMLAIQEARKKKSAMPCKKKLCLPRNTAENSSISSTQSSGRAIKKPRKQKITDSRQTLRRPKPVCERTVLPRKPLWMTSDKQSGRPKPTALHLHACITLSVCL